jgi:DNA processing protein
MNDDEHLALIVFNRITNYSPKQKFDLFERYKSAAKILSGKKEAESIAQKPFKINGKPLDIEKEIKSAHAELGYYRENEIAVIGLNDSRYPSRLRYIYDPPIVLYARGRSELLNAKHPVGVVGSRKASNAGITVAFSVSRELSCAGAVVVSGLASGIDFYAHKGALEGSASTIAVLGNGVDVVYPKDNEDMYDRVIKKGALVTEFPAGTPPFKQNFPKRNRIISGLSLGVAVVEASKKSGALITANYALDHGREVMAFPGMATSESSGGNNGLIKEGAHLVENASDILSVLDIDHSNDELNVELHCSQMESDILTVIGDTKVSLEEIESLLKAPVSKITSALMLLELKGAVVQYPGKIFSKVYRHGR